MKNATGCRGALIAALLVAVALLAGPSAAGDCNKDCSYLAQCVSVNFVTGAGICLRSVRIVTDANGNVTREEICETEAGPCGDWGPPEY